MGTASSVFPPETTPAPKQVPHYGGVRGQGLGRSPTLPLFQLLQPQLLMKARPPQVLGGAGLPPQPVPQTPGSPFMSQPPGMWL